MKQLYSRFYPFPHILNLIVNYSTGRGICGNGITRSISFTALFIPVILIVSVSFSWAQDKAVNISSDVKNISGSWLLTEAVVSENGKRVNSITKENCFWADHVNLGIPLKIEDNGAVTYSMDKIPASATVEIENENLIFYFKSGKVTKLSDKGDELSVTGNRSYTIYQYMLQGKQLMLTREDPEFSEKYIFKQQ